MKTIIRKMSWEDASNSCRYLSHAVKINGALYDVIVPIIRGGLVPGTILSHFLGNKTPVVPLQWQTRDGESDLRALYQICNKYSKILFVDDLIDSGETVDQISSHIEDNFAEVDFCFAVLKYNIDSQKPANMWRLLKEGRIRTASTYCAEAGQSIWWNFPWESNRDQKKV